MIQDFTRGIEEWGAKGIYLFGENGLGKSHLLSAGDERIARSWYQCRVYDSQTLDCSYPQTDRQMDYLNAYRAADVLIIDELGAEIPADWEMGELFTVLNGRQNRSPILYGSKLYGQGAGGKV
ncbi:DnaA ATPase domain-containing protein [Brevibacillus brevis]|uniref:DnaA ATPase domain-containing protein n=1 Tax=Brevibacillus brevis TaxID=1393 RepID=UPI003D1F8305